MQKIFIYWSALSARLHQHHTLYIRLLLESKSYVHEWYISLFVFAYNVQILQLLVELNLKVFLTSSMHLNAAIKTLIKIRFNSTRNCVMKSIWKCHITYKKKELRSLDMTLGILLFDVDRNLYNVRLLRKYGSSHFYEFDFLPKYFVKIRYAPNSIHNYTTMTL